MEIRLEMKNILPLLVLSLFIRTTHTNNVSSSDESRHPRVSGRIVKLYSGVKPEPIICSKEGFQADPKECAVFYRCVKGNNDKYTVFRYECGPGTVYDPDKEICNHPKSTRRLNCGGYATSSTESINENEIDVSRQEVPSPISTKRPVYTDKTTSKREVPTSSTTNHWYTSINYKSSQSTSVSTVGPWLTTTNNQNPRVTNSPDTHRPTSQTGEPCSSDGFMGDTENCRTFYRCVGNGRGGYIRYEFSCSESTIWDDEAQACNHAWAVKKRRCGRANPDGEINKSTTIAMEENEVAMDKTVQSQIQINYGSKVNQVQTQISKGPVIQNQTQINYGDRLNANPNSNFKQNQTQISHGSAVSQSQTQINHGNNGFQSQLQIDHTKESSQSQIQVQETTTSWTSAPSVSSDTQKPNTQKPVSGNNECTESGFMGDSNDCKKFFRCVDNGRGGYIKYEFSCGDGTVWDPNAEACNHEWAVKDCKNKFPSETISQDTKTTTTIKPQYSSTTEMTIMEDEDVGYGGQNEHQSSTTMKPNKPLTTTDSNTIISTTAKDSSTTSQSYSDKNVCSSSGFIGDSKDCKKFYRCVDNGKGGFTKYEYNCGEGTVWDSEIEACNHEWAVKNCVSSSEASVTGGPMTSDSSAMTTVSLIQTTTEPAGDDNDGGYGKPQTESLQTTTTSKKPEVTHLDQGNKCTASGFMGDNNDCKKFYRCVENGNGDFTRYEFACGEGTVWDAKLEACNHAWAVEGSGAGTPNKVTTEESTTSSSSNMQDDEIDSGYPSSSGNNTEKPVKSTTSTTITNTSSLPTSTETSSDDNKCQSSGFMGDKNDCKKFYRCVDDGKGGYTRYDFSCGEGTVWDQSIESCNHPSPDNNCKNSKPSTQQIQSETTTLGSSSSQSTISSDTTEDEIGKEDDVTSTKPSTDATVSNDGSCSMEGFFGDSKDCKKFYRCVENQNGGYTKYDFTCGEGTVWDSEINACNHAKSVKNGCSSQGNNIETTQKQPMPANDEYIETTTSQAPALSPTTESVAQEQSSSNNCESEGFFGNSDDCKKFYRCVDNGKGGYTKYDFTCGDGTVWDQKSQTCNHESSQTTCSSNSESSSSETTQSQLEATTPSGTSNESTTTTKRSPTDSITPSSSDQCSSEGFYANSNDCKKFYRCVDNGKGGYTKYDFACGDGTIWLQEIQACDHDNNISNCSAQTVSTTSVPQNNQEEQPITTSSTTVHSTTPEKESDEMPSDNSDSATQSDECKSEGFYANKNDCKKFYRCVDNGGGGFTRYDFTCGEGTAWDPDIQTCNHENEVKNCQGSQEQNQSESSAADDKPSQSTEAPNTTKTSTTKQPSENNQPNDKCEQEGYFGDSNDCMKFYRCVDNGNGGLTKYDFTCGEGTIWDQDITACNHPQDVQNPSCNGNNTSTTTEMSSGTSSTTAGSTASSESSSSSTTESQNSSDCSQSSTQKPQNQNVNCNKAGFYADPNDCKKFYRCVDWDNNGERFSVYHFDCGEGTIWDPAVETCNHEDSVYPPRECSSMQTQAQNTSDESTTSTTTSTTTQKSTEDQSTTQESTSTEEITTEMSSTSEQTSQSTSTSTTDNSSTTEQSTTSSTSTTTTTTTESTTSEQTTTQQSPTSEQTSTQQSTTGEASTTQSSSTTEQSTTQQSSTTIEQSTTQQSTTTEQSITEQSSTTEQSTTTQSTTSEQSTTEQSSTTEQNTTEESSTTEQSTTEESTTEESTTEQSTTTEQSSSTDDTTTHQSTTAEQTTTEQSSTTEQMTTEQSSSTEQTTTQESSATQQSTEATESPTTEQSSSSTTEDTTDSSTTESTQESTTDAGSTGSKDCLETDDDQNLYVCPTSFRRHPKYCNMFYQCTEDNDSHELNIAVFKCPNNTIYDETKTQCVEEDKADKKCNGQIAERRRVKRLGGNIKEPIEVSKERHVCHTTGNFPFEKSECSPAFLKCDKTISGMLRGFVYQCPEGYVYWSISKRCEKNSNVKDCKLSANDWRDRWPIPIERKNVAPK